MLDFTLRVGFEARLCQPYRTQTKGKVGSGVKYVRRNRWPSMRFTDDAGLNRQALEWCDAVAQTGGSTDDPPGTWGDAGRRAASPGEVAREGCHGPVSSEDRRGPGRLRQRRTPLASYWR